MGLRYLPSDQAQWRGVIIIAALAIVITVCQHSARSAGRLSAFEVAAKRVVWPLQSLLVGSGQAVRNVGVAAVRGGAIARENQELRRRVHELEADKILMFENVLEIKRIREKLGFEQEHAPEGVPARVVGRSSGWSRRRITIETGAGRELEVGNPVVTMAGLVGRVIEAHGDRGEVVLLLDAEHAVAGIVQPSRDEGLVYPAPEAQRGEQMLQLSKLSRGSDIRVGQTVLSSGLGEVYPPKIPIGTIERVERSPVGGGAIVAYVRPFVDFNHLDYVMVRRRSD